MSQENNTQQLQEISKEAINFLNNKITFLNQETQLTNQLKEVEELVKKISNLKIEENKNEKNQEVETLKFNLRGEIFETTKENLLKEDCMLKAIAEMKIPVEKVC